MKIEHDLDVSPRAWIFDMKFYKDDLMGGKDVEPEIVEQWADKKSNTIYIINGYKCNEVDNYFVSKDTWEKMKREFETI